MVWESHGGMVHLHLPFHLGVIVQVPAVHFHLGVRGGMPCKNLTPGPYKYLGCQNVPFEKGEINQLTNYIPDHPWDWHI